MKKVWIIVIAVVAAAAIGFGAWFFLTQFNKAGNSGIQGAGAEIDNSIATLNQAIALNKPITCVYEDDVEKGVAYIAGDSLIRYDFESKVTGQTSGGMLLTSSHIYTWDSDSKEGFKMPHNPVEDADEDDDFLDMDNENDYSCYQWSVDNAKFTPPSDIDFVDMGEMQNFV